MPHIICTVVSTIAAVFLGLFTVPIIYEYGLAPIFETLPPSSSFVRPSGGFYDHVFLKPYELFANDSADAMTFEPPPIIHAEDLPLNPKPSSSTTTTPPVVPQPTSSPSAWSCLRWIFARLVYAILTTEAALSLRIANFLLKHPPLASKPAVVIKSNQKDLLSEAEVFAFRRLTRLQWRTQRLARLRRRPGVRFPRTPKQPALPSHIPSHLLEMTIGQLLDLDAAMATYPDRATEPSSSLPPSPTSWESATSPPATPPPPVQPAPPRFPFRPNAADFIPLAERPRAGGP
ncbi:MAG: hypothetical protein Q9225_007180 [Loekoesia sp. 1 TL-2023]